MSVYSIGPIELENVLMGARTAFLRPNPPVDLNRVPDGWHLQRRRGKTRPWPSGWFRAADYWLSIWGASPEHITIKPYDGAWIYVAIK